MSADELRRRAVEVISETRDAAMQVAVNLRYRPMYQTGDGFMPAMTAEEIAFSAIEANAQVRALTIAINAINEVYRRMHQPDDEKIQQPKRVDLY
jgi:hypothetical protein